MVSARSLLSSVILISSAHSFFAEIPSLHQPAISRLFPSPILSLWPHLLLAPASRTFIFLFSFCFFDSTFLLSPPPSSHLSPSPVPFVLPESFRFVDRAASLLPLPPGMRTHHRFKRDIRIPPFSTKLRGQHQTCRQPRRTPASVRRASKRLVPSSSYPSRIFSLPPPAAGYPRWQRRVSITHHPALYLFIHACAETCH